MEPALATVQHLPNEMLAEVFLLVVLDGHRREDQWAAAVSRPLGYLQLLRCMLVCKRWHDIIMVTHSLWTMLSFSCDLAFLSRILVRSSTQPLDVVCHIRDTKTRNEVDLQYDRLRHFLSLTSPHAARWASIKLQLEGVEVDNFDAILLQPLPRLRVLDISVSYDQSDNLSALNLLGGQRPTHLREIRLEGVSAFWDSALFSGLQVIVIRGPMWRDPTTAQVRNMLDLCHDLRELELHNVYLGAAGHEEVGEVVHIAPSADLPCLRRLEITESAGYKNCSDIIAYIKSMPSLKTFVFSSDDTLPGPASYLISALDRHRDTFKKLFSTKHLLSVHTSEPMEFSVDGMRGGSSINVQGIEGIAGGLFHWMALVLNPRVPLLKLWVSRPPALIHLLPIRAFDVLELVISHRIPRNAESQRAYSDLLQALGGLSSATWGNGFALPNLRMLRIDADDVQDDALLLMLKRRSEATSSATQGAPVRQFKLSLPKSRVSFQTLREIRGIIGRGNICLHPWTFLTPEPPLDPDDVYASDDGDWHHSFSRLGNGLHDSDSE